MGLLRLMMGGIRLVFFSKSTNEQIEPVLGCFQVVFLHLYFMCAWRAYVLTWMLFHKHNFWEALAQ